MKLLIDGVPFALPPETKCVRLLGDLAELTMGNLLVTVEGNVTGPITANAGIIEVRGSVTGDVRATEVRCGDVHGNVHAERDLLCGVVRAGRVSAAKQLACCRKGADDEL